MKKCSLSSKTLLGILLPLTVLVHTLLTVFSKAAVLPQELLSLQLSRDLSQGPVCGLLYPLLLSPFNWIPDGILRIKAISVLNILLMASSLIPAWLLSKRLLKKESLRIVALLLLAADANLFLSVTFLSDNLFLPLLLWGFLFAVRAFDKGTLKNSLLLGFWTLLLLLAGTRGWAFALAAAAGYGWRLQTDDKKHRTRAAAAFLGAFLVPYILLRLVIPQASMFPARSFYGTLPDTSRLLYLLYAAGLLLLHFLLTAGWFPVALPVARLKHLSAAQRALLVLSVSYVLCLSFGLAYDFSVPRDFANLSPETLLRYLLGASFPFLLLFLDQLEETESPKWKSPIVIHTGVFLALMLLFFRLPSLRGTADSPALLLTRLLSPANRNLWLLKGALLLAGAALLLLWKGRGIKAMALLLLPALAAFQLANGAYFIRQERKEYRASADITEPLPDKTVLLLAENPLSAETRTLVTRSNKAIPVSAACLRRLKAEGQAGNLPLDSLSLTSPYGETLEYRLSNAEYIVTVGSVPQLETEALEDVTPDTGSADIRICHAADPSVLPLTEAQACRLEEPISFAGADASFLEYLPTGFSGPESTFTWSEGHESTLTLKPELGSPQPLHCKWTYQMTIGEQEVIIRVNDTILVDDTIEGAGGLFFSIPASAFDETGRITLHFEFPDAREPGNGDPRLLAVAFEQLELAK